MDRALTLEEIEAQFTPDCVLIGDPWTDNNLALLGGVVLFHSPDRDEVYRKARELVPGRSAVRHLATWSDETALVL